MLILPPRPRLHKRPHASHLQFFKSHVLSAVFFVPAVLHTHFFVNFLIFFTNLLPALGGEHDFESCMYVKSSKNVPLSTQSYPKSHRKTLSWGHLLQVKTCKFLLKKRAFPVHGLSWVCISCATCRSMSAGLARCTFFFQNLLAFFKKCSPPSVASTFFKQISNMFH